VSAFLLWPLATLELTSLALHHLARTLTKEN
jgi:hypothetical protein